MNAPASPGDADVAASPGRHRIVADLAAVAAWTVTLAAFFWDVASFRSALFYFDITEINFPYREFFARELAAGRFSRWMPGLYCGMPLFSESQAGYLHPLKYALYPWLEPWRAFGLDTVLSIWLAGLGTYGWLRRRVGPIGALAGATIFGLGGFTWAHFVHTSMINALASVPLALWALECCWDGGRLRGVALGGLALACQVFAGHLQDFLFSAMLVGVYGAYRAAIESTWRRRAFALGTAAGVATLGVLLSGVQWVPSKELLDRSPRAGGLTWGQLTFGSWSPELLPTMVVREAYGTRARDTDWMDGFYPYHEMNTYLGLIAIGLAVVGLGARRDRWVAFWPILAALAALLMLGRHTALLDYAHRVPVLGSSRIPVRFHLWMTLAVAALAAVGADRLARPGRVRVRWASATAIALVLLSIPILAVVYGPIRGEPDRWGGAYQRARSAWLGRELAIASARTAALALLGFAAMASAGRSAGARRAVLAACLPALIAADLLGAHWWDVPTIDPSYWTEPPASAGFVRDDPDHQRVSGLGAFSAGEPGYASTEVDFMAARDTLAWSLPPAFGLRSVLGETPMIPRRWKRYMDASAATDARHAVDGATHLLVGYPGRIPGWPPPTRVGTAYIHRNPRPLPRARLVGRPLYADDQDEAAALVERLGERIRDRLVVEDPDRPLPGDAVPRGRVAIRSEVPERVVVEVDAETDAYLFLADTYDPGWSATLDGAPVPIRPAHVNFRAVFVPGGAHEVIFRYRPAGFRLGLALTIVGGITALALLSIRRPLVADAEAAGSLGWPSWWPAVPIALAALLVVGSSVTIGPGGPRLHPRWNGSLHPFTWGAGIEAMQPPPGQSP